MKYLVTGAGGVGGMLAACLKNANKDVSLIARNKHLNSIKEKGLRVSSKLTGDLCLNIDAFSQEEYTDKPDIIFVCVKYYSINSIIPFLKKICDKTTIIIPLLNGFGIGQKIQSEAPELNVIDGCVYIVSYIGNDDVIIHNTKLFKIIFGARKNQLTDFRILKEVEKDLNQSGIKAVVSDNIEKETYSKFTLISSYAACGAFFDVPLKNMQQDCEIRNFLIGLLSELQLIADKMNLKLDFDVVNRNLEIIDKMSPETISSLYRDIMNGHEAEIDGQIFDVVRLACKLGTDVPFYRQVADKFNFKE